MIKITFMDGSSKTEKVTGSIIDLMNQYSGLILFIDYV